MAGENVEEGADVTQSTQYLHGVHFLNSVVTLRSKSMRIELSNSRYNRQMIASGNALLNFNSILVLPLSVWAYDPPTRPYHFRDQIVT